VTHVSYALTGYLHAAAHQRLRAIRPFAEGERGQGTVEYVGLILLVSLLMVGMVAAMKGFNNKWPLGGLPVRA
jgi:Flp pilus assembly pilin Flp